MEEYSTRVKASPAQINYMIKYMRSTPIHRRPGKTEQEKANIEASWERLSAKLNSMGPTIKTVVKWKQAWRDHQNNLKKKRAAANQASNPKSTSHQTQNYKDVTQTSDQDVSLMSPMDFYDIPVGEDSIEFSSSVLETSVASASHPESGDLSSPAIPSMKQTGSSRENCGSTTDKQTNSSESDNEEAVPPIKIEYLDPLSANYDESAYNTDERLNKLWSKKARIEQQQVKKPLSQNGDENDEDDDDDNDEKFLLSLRGDMKRMTSRQKLGFKIAMLQFIKQIHSPYGS